MSADEGTQLLEDARRFAPILERMVDILADDNMTFGAALAQAARELGLEVPEHVEAALLTTAFKIFGGRGFPGAPDA